MIKKKILIVGLIIMIIMSYTHISNATTKSDLQEEQSELKNTISETKAELNNIEKEKSKTLNEVQNLIAQISNYQEEIDDLNSEISGLQIKIKDAEKKIQEDEEEYKEQKIALDERLIAMYENGETSYLDVVLAASSLTDLISSYYMVSELTSYDTEMLNKIEEDKQKIENEKLELEKSKEVLNTTKTTKEAKSTALKEAKKQKEDKASSLSEEEKATKKELEEMQETKAEIDSKLRKIAEEEAVAAKKAAEEAIKKKNQSQTNNSTGNSTSSVVTTKEHSTSGYIFPVAGLNKSSIANKSYPSYAGHTGVDINIGVSGKSVVAAKNGVVLVSTAKKNASGEYISYGEYVIINHNDGTMTVYAHMQAGSRRVQEGQSVKQGQVIGIVGSTGNSTGDHLHFEIRTLANSYRAVNPLPYLP